MDQYTHDFVFKVGDGGKFVTGEVEFNTDGKNSYRFETLSQPLQDETLIYSYGWQSWLRRFSIPRVELR